MDILRDLVAPRRRAGVRRRGTFDPIAADKGLALRDRRGSPTCRRRFITDEQRLQQILKNLLSNAFKFTETGGVTLQGRARGRRTRTRLRRARHGHRHRARQACRLIFEAFQQADGTTSRKYGGTGLGLSISRELARALGGEIKVASTVGRGTIFTLILPISRSLALGASTAATIQAAGRCVTERWRETELRASAPGGRKISPPRASRTRRPRVGRPRADGARTARRLLIVERGARCDERDRRHRRGWRQVVTTTASAADEAAAMLAGATVRLRRARTGNPKDGRIRTTREDERRARLQGAPLILCLNVHYRPGEGPPATFRAHDRRSEVVESPEQLTAATSTALRRKPVDRLQ